MNKLLNVFLLSFITFYNANLFSQEKQDSIKISGYIQSQYQYFFVPDSVGATTNSFATFSGGNFVNRFTNQRFMIRRGRLNITYYNKINHARIAFDVTERGIAVKDAYFQYYEPWLQSIYIKGGMFNRPFGQEIGLSSALRETPERSRIIQTLFPNERDVGFTIGVDSIKDVTSLFDISIGIVNGNGTNYETNNFKDILGRIGIKYNKDKFSVKFGFSGYNGYINHIHEPVDTIASNTNTKFYIYRFENIIDTTGRTTKGFVVQMEESKAAGRMGKGVERQYLGVDGEIKFRTPLGPLTIRAEYIWGIQPAVVNFRDVEQAYIIYSGMNSLSPSGPVLGVSWPMYDQPQPYNPAMVVPTNKFHHTFVRNFAGGYIYFIQNIFETNHQIVFKYDWYDPNTKVTGKEIIYDEALYFNDPTYIKPYLSPADIKFETYGIGFNFTINKQLKAMLYYEHVMNEKAKIKPYVGDIRLGRMPSPGYENDIKDDVLTIRLQYKF
ncbi:MAG: hypothetical protein N2449_05325 [Bacteroidales bacterium]|nr:hypothetical protein [Bacteroidales bacterium]